MATDDMEERTQTDTDRHTDTDTQTVPSRNRTQDLLAVSDCEATALPTAPPTYLFDIQSTLHNFQNPMPPETCQSAYGTGGGADRSLIPVFDQFQASY